jgi:hypothetical protein
MNNYYPNSHTSFWHNLRAFTLDGKLLSVDQVYQELANQDVKPYVFEWMEENKRIFRTPTTEESRLVAQIFAVPKFQESLKQKQRIKKGAFADPWLVAAGKIYGACIVTEERKPMHSSHIPNICEYFEVSCTNMEGFLDQNGWQF